MLVHVISNYVYHYDNNHLSYPQSIKRVIDHRTVDLYALFSDELNLVKKEFTRQAPVLPASQPQHSGRASWARRLKRRIDAPMKVSQCCLYVLTSEAPCTTREFQTILS